MRGVFWIALGATAGVLVFRRLDRAAEAFTPGGIANALGGVGDSLRDLADAVREGMAEREQELRTALGVDAASVDDEAAQSLMDDPTGRRRV